MRLLLVLSFFLGPSAHAERGCIQNIGLLATAHVLRSALLYWKGKSPSERDLALVLVQKTREQLGDERFVQAANRGLALLTNNRESLASAALDFGLRPIFEQNVTRASMDFYLRRGEPVAILEHHPRNSVYERIVRFVLDSKP